MRQEAQDARREAEGGDGAEHIDPHQESGDHAEIAGTEPAGEQNLAQKGDDGRDKADGKRDGGTGGLASWIEELSQHWPPTLASGA